MRKWMLAAFATFALSVPTAAHAAPLTGTFSLVGLDPVVVTLNTIDWGQVFFNPIGTGDFVVLNGTNGELADLSAVANPVGVPFVTDDFLTAFAEPAWNFQLNFIDPGTGTPAGCTDTPGDVCTPFPTSPFTITNDDNGGSSVSLSLNGVVIAGGDASPFAGIFSTQFVNLTAAEILALLAAEGSVTSSHSASFIVSAGPVSVPEPATMMLLGIGVVGLGMAGRRLRR